MKDYLKKKFEQMKPFVKSFLKAGANQALQAGKGYALSKVKRYAPDAANLARATSAGLLQQASKIAGGMIQHIPSMASGGIVDAPPRKGRVVRLHRGELVVPAKKVGSVLRALHKSKIALPLISMRAKLSKRK